LISGAAPSDEVDDVVQDTLLTLYTHLHEIDPPQKLRPFLFRVARNRCYDILRHQGRWDQVALEDDEAPLDVRVAFNMQDQIATSPEDAANWLLLYMEVKEAIERLPENQRQALILFSEEELSYIEIAEVMDVSVGTVKSRLFHAKKNLRGLLRPRTLAALEDSLGLWDEPRNGLEEEDDHDDNGSGYTSEAAPASRGTQGAA
jgi:RNA polymerase sigma-70 factor (ECF subfamily)